MSKYTIDDAVLTMFVILNRIINNPGGTDLTKFLKDKKNFIVSYDNKHKTEKNIEDIFINFIIKIKTYAKGVYDPNTIEYQKIYGKKSYDDVTYYNSLKMLCTCYTKNPTIITAANIKNYINNPKGIFNQQQVKVLKPFLVDNNVVSALNTFFTELKTCKVVANFDPRAVEIQRTGWTWKELGDEILYGKPGEKTFHYDSTEKRPLPSFSHIGDSIKKIINKFKK